MPSSFLALGLTPALLGVVKELGFENPTSIQEQSLPHLLAGKDLVGQSKTGSGKTLAFALTILNKIRLVERRLQALVLCPTRELSLQVSREIRKLGRRYPGLVVLPVVGGEPARAQTKALEQGVHIVVGTPGRILDHLRRGRLHTEQVCTAVLDEADRMLDMGFANDLEAILSALPSVRQTLLFSATFPAAFEEISRGYQLNPVFVRVEDDPSDVPSIRQLQVRTLPQDKLQTLQSVLRQYPHQSALVFVNFKLTAAELAAHLEHQGISATCFHGDLEQVERNRVLARFRNASTRILVATDVAARGLDIQGLDLVINYDVPQQQEAYLHRIGRTGRAGRAGLAVTLVVPAEQVQLAAIEQFIGLPIPQTVVEESLPATTANRGEPSQGDASTVTLQISGGRKQKLRPGDILGALTGEAGSLRGEDVGRIEIHDHYSYVAVPKALSRLALKSLSAGKIKGKRFRITLVG